MHTDHRRLSGCARVFKSRVLPSSKLTPPSISLSHLPSVRIHLAQSRRILLHQALYTDQQPSSERVSEISNAPIHPLFH
ncbi:hypothetical protein DACRYDRAFT_21683 [Dacryopinax primogenitus]|uniref:Uncharacterized protein n=1 Tax=Dacryopinax primogenitus (strain DJM 731) TaxID=1858805 RepID=M5GDS5_DACPD|nr:uncharacterized protein DACRYDRAFT_21683 [Dacryopinax primogenitus]EJU02653.1 hypothetical protein DACRYDRAFT_21683 [Dacryopinax primogenitus]